MVGRLRIGGMSPDGGIGIVGIEFYYATARQPGPTRWPRAIAKTHRQAALNQAAANRPRQGAALETVSNSDHIWTSGPLRIARAAALPARNASASVE